MASAISFKKYTDDLGKNPNVDNAEEYMNEETINNLHKMLEDWCESILRDNNMK